MKIVLTREYDHTVNLTVNGENAEDITNAEIRDTINQILRTVRDKKKLISFLTGITESVGEFSPLSDHQELKTDAYKFEMEI